MRTPWPVWRRFGRELSRAVLDAVLPPACAACGAPLDPGSDALCRRCGRLLVARPAHACGRCGGPVVPGRPCGTDHARLRHVSQLLAPFRFAGTGGRLVRRLKFDGDAAAGRLLARAMADCYRERVGRAGRPVLVPVPLHRARRRRRGFDQAAWLGRGLGRRLGLRIVEDALVRRRATAPQGHALVTSRAANVRGAFALLRPERFAGRGVVLVDDVFTSGATARACAGLLRAAGARPVRLLVACVS